MIDPLRVQLRNVLLANVILASCAAGLGCGFLHASDVRLNQLGYLPQASKIAIVESSATAALTWQVVDGAGGVLAKGTTEPRGSDADSGDSVQWADFSSFTRPGKDYRLLVDGEESFHFAIGARVYQPLKTASFNYFYQNRSGTAIEIPWAGEWQWTHGPGHLSDADVGCINDCGYRLNVLGGWYDAGDHGKYVVNAGISVWTLLDLYERTKYLHGNLDALGDGALNIPENDNGVPDVLDEARWEIEFLLAMQVPPGHEKSGMVHHKIHDSSWTTLGRVPPETWKDRYLHAPSTAATLNLAANAAQCFRLWKEIEPQFAERCRVGAIRAWNAAQKFPAVYAPNYDSQGGGPYDDGDVSDEFYWAACELFLAFGSPDLLDFVEHSPHHRTFPTETGHEHVKHYTSLTWQSTAAQLGHFRLGQPARHQGQRDRAERGSGRAARADRARRRCVSEDDSGAGLSRADRSRQQRPLPLGLELAGRQQRAGAGAGARLHARAKVPGRRAGGPRVSARAQPTQLLICEWIRRKCPRKPTPSLLVSPKTQLFPASASRRPRGRSQFATAGSHREPAQGLPARALLHRQRRCLVRE